MYSQSPSFFFSPITMASRISVAEEIARAGKSAAEYLNSNPAKASSFAQAVIWVLLALLIIGGIFSIWWCCWCCGCCSCCPFGRKSAPMEVEREEDDDVYEYIDEDDIDLKED
jgi:hypothetical protein